MMNYEYREAEAFPFHFNIEYSKLKIKNFIVVKGARAELPSGRHIQLPAGIPQETQKRMKRIPTLGSLFSTTTINFDPGTKHSETTTIRRSTGSQGGLNSNGSSMVSRHHKKHKTNHHFFLFTNRSDMSSSRDTYTGMP